MLSLITVVPIRSFSLTGRTIERASFSDKLPHGLAARIWTRLTGLVVDEMAALVLAFGSIRGDEVTDAGAAVRNRLGQHVLHHIVQTLNGRCS